MSLLFPQPQRAIQRFVLSGHVDFQKAGARHLALQIDPNFKGHASLERVILAVTHAGPWQRPYRGRWTTAVAAKTQENRKSEATDKTNLLQIVARRTSLVSEEVPVDMFSPTAFGLHMDFPLVGGDVVRFDFLTRYTKGLTLYATLCIQQEVPVEPHNRMPRIRTP